MSAMPAWAMISVRLGVALDERREPGRDRRQPAAAVDQDRHAPLGRELEHRPEPLVGRVEALRARVQLDPARAGVEAARRLLDRRLVQVEPDERDEPPVRARGERERAVVRGAEGGMPVGLVEAEHERARDRRARPSAARAGRSRRPCRRCRVPRWRCASKISAPVGQQPPDLLVVAHDQLERAFEGVGHPRKLTARGRAARAACGARVPPRARRPDLRRHGPLAGAAARGPAARARPVPLRRARTATGTSWSARWRSRCSQDLSGFELHPLEEFGDRRAAPQRHRVDARSTTRSRCAPCARSASSSATVPGELPGAARRPAARRRRRADARPRALRPPPPREVRRRARRASAAPRPRPTRRWARRATCSARASPNGDGVLELDGEPLTTRARQGARSAASSSSTARAATTSSSRTARSRRSATTSATGALRAGEPIVIDIWPRDDASACCADMTRTFVVGDVPDEVAEWHRLCARGARARARPRSARASPGKSVFDGVCDIFEAAGYPTQRTKAEGETLEERLLPLARPRRRPRGARAADARHDRPRRARRRRRARDRAGPLPRRATAAAGSRTSCSSPRTAPRR